MENPRPMVPQKRVSLVPSLRPVGVRAVRKILGQPYDGDSFRPGCGLKLRVLINREVVRLILPEEDRPVVRRLVASPIDCTLEELRPDEGRVLADLAVLGNRDIDHDNLAVQNIVWSQIGSGTKELAYFAAGEVIKHSSKICVNRLACFAGKCRAFDHPVIAA